MKYCNTSETCIKPKFACQYIAIIISGTREQIVPINNNILQVNIDITALLENYSY